MANLAAGLAHDLRNPLTTIKTFAAVLHARKDQPGFLERFERSVAEGITRIEALLDDLTDLADQDGPCDSFAETVNLSNLLACCLETLDEELAVRDIALDLSAEKGLPPVHGHAARLRKAFVSLLRFSCQIMGSGGTLAVSVERCADGNLSAHFAGNGLGIADEHLQKLFEPYFATHKRRGAGLNLALARKIIHEHGGTIDAVNRPSQGTTFRVHLPAWQ